jgi:hypothetical protein
MSKAVFPPNTGEPDAKRGSYGQDFNEWKATQIPPGPSGSMDVFVHGVVAMVDVGAAVRAELNLEGDTPVQPQPPDVAVITNCPGQGSCCTTARSTGTPRVTKVSRNPDSTESVMKFAGTA